MAESSYVHDITADNFETLVLQASQQHPVMVDFWAPWCGPCQSLGPLLEKLADEYAGAFTLAKINTDEEQMVASQFGVRSLPTVVLLFQGQIVDHFVGAQTEGEVRALLERHVGPPPAQDDADDDWQQQLAELDPADRVAVLRRQLETGDDQPALRAELADALLRAGDADEARRQFEQLPNEFRDGDDASVRAVKTRFEFIDALGDDAETPPERLAERVEAAPDDLAARHRLGLRLLLADRFEDGLQQLLTVMQRDRQFEDDLGRRSLVSAFALVDDPALVSRYRSRMTSLLF